MAGETVNVTDPLLQPKGVVAALKLKGESVGLSHDTSPIASESHDPNSLEIFRKAFKGLVTHS
jgi:hypothetical protein